MARATLAVLKAERHALRVMLRDLDAFPELNDRVVAKVIRPLYKSFAGWVGHQQVQGRFVGHDPQAAAAVAIGSLTYFRILDALAGERPGQVNDERFIRTWVDLVLSGLRAKPSPVSKRRGAQ